jgi:hypothetical protein
VERIRLDQHTVKIELAKQLFEHRPLMVFAGGVASLAVAVRLLRRRSLLEEKQYATPRAAEYSVTWAMNAEPPPAVGSIEPLKVLPSHTS